MQVTGTIRPDGSVQYHGYAPMDCQLLGIMNGYIALKFAGGVYWDNGGKHYVPAYIEVDPLQSLEPAGDGWEFRLKNAPRAASFHPQASKATRAAMNEIQGVYERMQRQKEHDADYERMQRQKERDADQG